MKCSIPSYIAEFVTVEAWIREDGEVYIPEDPAVGQQGIAHERVSHGESPPRPCLEIFQIFNRSRSNADSRFDTTRLER